MKKWQMGICATCAVVLGAVASSTVAQAAGTVVPAARSPRVEVIDVPPVANCIQGFVSANLLDAVAAEGRDLAARLSREASAALLQQPVLTLELPGFARPESGAAASRKLVSTVAE